jgi:pantoate--beta-alanine ligase
MIIFKKKQVVKTYVLQLKKQNQTVGFVPTMGSLHAGHISLIKASQADCDKTIVSIFVNPLQFGQGEDFAKYPRKLATDVKILEDLKIDGLFLPAEKEMYTDGHLTFVDVTELSKKLCGKTRPEHFKGVATVVLKLLNIVGPDVLFLGQKDMQQAVIIKKMLQDLDLDIAVKIFPIIRETDGLAMSSRNKYLNSAQRETAPEVYKSLRKARNMIAQGELRAAVIKNKIKETLGKFSLKIDYIEIVNNKNLAELSVIGDNALIAVAVFLGNVRLIDNILIEGVDK